MLVVLRRKNTTQNVKEKGEKEKEKVFNLFNQHSFSLTIQLIRILNLHHNLCWILFDQKKKLVLDYE